MKSLIFSTALSLVLLLTACSGTKNSVNNQAERKGSTVKVSNLLHHLDSIPRLRVEGHGYNAIVLNSSVSSFHGGLTPLFILDGIQVGIDYREVAPLLSQNEYVTVQFLTTRRATIRYGEAGRNGVIIINRSHTN